MTSLFGAPAQNTGSSLFGSTANKSPFGGTTTGAQSTATGMFGQRTSSKDRSAVQHSAPVLHLRHNNQEACSGMYRSPRAAYSAEVPSGSRNSSNSRSNRAAYSEPRLDRNHKALSLVATLNRQLGLGGDIAPGQPAATSAATTAITIRPNYHGYTTGPAAAASSVIKPMVSRPCDHWR